jgi:RimJ/RimL family protein N-acetyltransferase
MEKMPHQPSLDEAPIAPALDDSPYEPASWRTGLPTYRGRHATLRELHDSDAAALLVSMSSQEVSRFISPPPSTLQGFEKFIAWAHRERAAGRYVCFAVVPTGSDSAVGLFQLRSLDSDFGTSEWGFAIASEYWGSGMFTEGAEFVVDFAVTVIGVHRLEARAALRNGRGNGALRKLGAVHECVLRRSFLRHGEYLDQSLWTILAEEWLQSKAVWSSNVVH